MKKVTSGVLVVGLIASLLLAGSYFGFLPRLTGVGAAAPSDYDPNTRAIPPVFIAPSMIAFGGYWDDPAARPSDRKQLLDSPQYITSFKPTGNSEAIVPTATVSISLLTLKQAHWQYFTSTGGDWTLVKDTPASPPVTISGTATIPPPNPLYYLVGEKSGWIRVQFVAEVWTPGINIFDGDALNDYRFAGILIGDDAVLVSGRGTITAPGELTVFAVGDKIPITVDLGSACSGKVSGDSPATEGYTLELYSDGQGKTVKTWDLPCGPGTFSIDKLGARLEYVVQSIDFTKASGCRNTITLRLFNNLGILRDQTDVKTIDLRSNQPAPPKLSAVLTDGTVWEEGKSVRITVSEVPDNALVNLVAEYEGTGVSLLRKDGVPERTFDITPPVAGVIKITASVVIDCVSSNTVEATLVIREKEPIDFVENAIGNLLWVIFLLIGIAAILLSIFIPYLDLKVRVIAFLIGLVLIIVALFLVGVL